jgi:hypothetical protein
VTILSQPISWSTKYSALYAWVYGATGIDVRWADQNAPRPDFPYILLDVTTLTKEGGVDEVTRTTDLTRARDVKVTPIAQNATTYTVTINGTDFAFMSDNDATVAEITAGLTQAINLGSEPVTATDNGTDLDIVGDDETLNPGTPQLYTIEVTDDYDGSQISWANNDTGNEIEIKATGSRIITLNVQAFARNTRADNQAIHPDRNAYNTLTVLQASLGLPTVQAQLRAADIALIEELPIIDLSEEVEDSILSRASMDVRMRTLSVLREYVGYIDTVSGEGTVTGTQDDPVTVPWSA